jgi:hypothetical protein
MMGLKATNPVEVLFRPPSRLQKITIPTSAEYRAKFQSAHEALVEMQSTVAAATARRRVANAKQKEKQACYINFDIGDKVLHAAVRTKRDVKLNIIWKGPYEIVEVINDYVYKIAHMITGKPLTSHATRLQFYSSDQLEMTDLLVDTLAAQDSSLFSIERILEHQYDRPSMSFEFKIHWQGFADEEDSFEPFTSVYVAAPKLVKEYVRKLPASRERTALNDLIT